MPRADLEQFKTYVEPELGNLYRAAYRLSGNRFDAEDLVQETCLRAWQKFPAEWRSGHMGRWLFRVLYHLFIDRARREQRGPIRALNGREDPTPELMSAQPGPEALAELDDSEQLLDQAWSRLDNTQKVLLALRGEGYGLDEIEEITSISRKVLRARLHRARRSLARHLHDLEESIEMPTRVGSSK